MVNPNQSLSTDLNTLCFAARKLQDLSQRSAESLGLSTGGDRQSQIRLDYPQFKQPWEAYLLMHAYFADVVLFRSFIQCWCGMGATYCRL